MLLSFLGGYSMMPFATDLRTFRVLYFAHVMRASYVRGPFCPRLTYVAIRAGSPRRTTGCVLRRRTSNRSSCGFPERLGDGSRKHVVTSGRMPLTSLLRLCHDVSRFVNRRQTNETERQNHNECSCRTNMPWLVASL